MELFGKENPHGFKTQILPLSSENKYRRFNLLKKEIWKCRFSTHCFIFPNARCSGDWARPHRGTWNSIQDLATSLFTSQGPHHQGNGIGRVAGTQLRHSDIRCGQPKGYLNTNPEGSFWKIPSNKQFQITIFARYLLEDQ